jgi:hypothetical protein
LSNRRGSNGGVKRGMSEQMGDEVTGEWREECLRQRERRK